MDLNTRKTRDLTPKQLPTITWSLARHRQPAKGSKGLTPLSTGVALDCCHLLQDPCLLSPAPLSPHQDRSSSSKLHKPRQRACITRRKHHLSRLPTPQLPRKHHCSRRQGGCLHLPPPSMCGSCLWGSCWEERRGIRCCLTPRSETPEEEAPHWPYLDL